MNSHEEEKKWAGFIVSWEKVRREKTAFTMKL